MFSSLVLNLLLVSFAMAEETLAATTHGNTWKYGTSGGVLGFIVLILDILVFSTSSASLLPSPTTNPLPVPSPQPNPRVKISSPRTIELALEEGNVLIYFCAVEVLKSNRPPSHKLLWCVFVFLFPILGFLIYWLFSNREAHAGSGSYEVIP